MTESTVSASQAYAVYLTVASDAQAVGTVVNRVMWDGSAAWSPPAGQAAVADPQNKYPIGSVYTAGSS